MRAQGMKTTPKIQQHCAYVHPFARLRARVMCVLACKDGCFYVFEYARACVHAHIYTCMRVIVHGACIYDFEFTFLCFCSCILLFVHVCVFVCVFSMYV